MREKNGVQRAVARIGDGTQRDVGNRLNPPVSQTSVYKWCKRGHAPLPRAKELSELSGIPIQYLIKPEEAEILGMVR